MSSRGQDAVSSVIGTVLMLGITVSVFAGLSITVLSKVSEDTDATHADLSVLEGDAAVLLRHHGGEDLRLQSGRLLLNIDGVEVEADLSDFSGDTADGEGFAIGDTLCLSCAYPGQDILGVVLVYGDELIMSHGERGSSSGAGSPKPDLVASNLTFTPASPWNGTTVTFTVTVTNQGAATAPASTLTITVDVTTLTASIPVLATGASVDHELDWTAVTGTHVATATADSAGAVTESDEANNDASTSITVSAGTPDPGAPFEDADGDGLYVSGTDILLTLGDISGGTYDAGANGLVIPASVGALSAASWDIDGNGTHRIHVNLSATAGDLIVDGVGGVYANSVSLASAGDMIIASTGDADLSGSSFTATTDLAAGSWSQSADLAGSTFTSGGALAVGTSGTGTVDATDVVANGVGRTQILGSDAAVTATNAQVTSSTERAYIIGTSVVADGAQLDGATWAMVQATSGTVSATDATLTSITTAILSTGDMDVRDATLSGTSVALAYTSGGDLLAHGIAVQAATTGTSYAYLLATGTIQADDADMDGTAVLLSGTDGVTTQDADLNGYAGAVTVAAQADIDVQGTTLRAASLTLDADDAGNEVFVQDACFLDEGGNPASPSIEPSGITVTGTPACGTVGTPDPGFPYEDTNGDGTYTAGTDNALDPSDVQDGDHDAGASGLIIPASVGPISAGSIDFSTTGDMDIAVDLTATSGDMNLEAGGTMTIDASLTTISNNRDIYFVYGTLDAPGLEVTSQGKMSFEGGATDLTNGVLETGTNDKDILFDLTGDLTAPGITVNGRGHIEAVTTGSMELTGATLETLTNGKDVDLDADGDVELDGATVTSRGKVEVKADDIHVEGTDFILHTNGEDFHLDADGWLHADADTTLDARGKVELDAANMRIEGMTIDMWTNNKDFIATSTGLLDADDIDIESRGHIRFTATGDLYLQRAILVGYVNNKDINLEGDDIHLQDASLTCQDDATADVDGTVYVEGLSTDDQNDALDVTPNGASSGTPSSGGVD